MANKYLNGPWTVEIGDEEGLTIDCEEGSICTVDCPADEMQEVANLIAAAPDLLEALLKVQKDLEQWSLKPSTEKLVNSAISKTTYNKV